MLEERNETRGRGSVDLLHAVDQQIKVLCGRCVGMHGTSMKRSYDLAVWTRRSSSGSLIIKCSTRADPNQPDFYVFLDELVSDVSGSGGMDATFAK